MELIICSRRYILLIPILDTRTTKDVFSDPLIRYTLGADEVLVPGDDPELEIKANLALEIPVIL